MMRFRSPVKVRPSNVSTCRTPPDINRDFSASISPRKWQKMSFDLPLSLRSSTLDTTESSLLALRVPRYKSGHSSNVPTSTSSLIFPRSNCGNTHIWRARNIATKCCLPLSHIPFTRLKFDVISLLVSAPSLAPSPAPAQVARQTPLNGNSE